MTPRKTILALTCLFLPIAATTTCPTKEDVAPCICKDYPGYGTSIECDKIDDGDLLKVTGNLGGMKFVWFRIINSKLGSIPHDVFKGIKFSTLAINNSTLATLTDRGEAFAGLEDHLEDLIMSNCSFTKKWDWFVLRRLKKLKVLRLVQTLHLDTIGTDDMKASVSSTVKIIDFPGNNISLVSDRAFDSYKNLRSLNLANNEIKHVKRTMLPNPALELIKFDISGNLIEILPEDMFANMWNLEYLYIGKNQIVVLNEKTFSPVWEKLRSLNTLDNPLRCDCRMHWLLEKMLPIGLTGKCASPPKVEGRNLKELKSIDFEC